MAQSDHAMQMRNEDQTEIANSANTYVVFCNSKDEVR